MTSPAEAAIAKPASAAPLPWDAKYCQTCGTVGRPVTRVKGAFLIELILYLFMILPGVLYTVWRLT
jgi:hypothetical protein